MTDARCGHCSQAIRTGLRYCSAACANKAKPKPPRVEHHCVQCSAAYTVHPARSKRGTLYCSAACRRAAWAKRSEMRPCGHCGKAFRYLLCMDKFERKAGKYCSRKCREAASRVTVECAACLQPFTRIRFYGRVQKCCSQKCAGLAPKPPALLTCPVCRAEFSVRSCEVGARKTCSFACAAAHRKNRRKEIRNRLGWSAWKRLRLAIIERDGGKCVTCGATDNLTVHHIIPWRVSRDDSEVNLQTLCRTCHGRAEPHHRMRVA